MVFNCLVEIMKIVFKKSLPFKKGLGYSLVTRKETSIRNVCFGFIMKNWKYNINIQVFNISSVLFCFCCCSHFSWNIIFCRNIHSMNTIRKNLIYFQKRVTKKMMNIQVHRVHVDVGQCRRYDRLMWLDLVIEWMRE